MAPPVGFDVGVVGAGPAGCAAAIAAARAGRRVLLFDRAAFPRPKPCGEGLLPPSLARLRELGILDEARRRGRPIAGVAVIAPGGRAARQPLPAGAEAFSMRRDELDALLLERARREGVTVRERFPVRLPAARAAAGAWVVADGLGSPNSRALGARALVPSRVRYGLSARLSGVPAVTPWVEVYLAAPGEFYLTGLSEGAANLAWLVEERQLKRFSGGSRAAFLAGIAACAPLRRRLGGAALAEELRGRGPLGAAADRVCGPGWWLAGDAAGAVDPITGEGVALALGSGLLAGRAAAGLPMDYARERSALAAPAARLAFLLLAASRHRAAAELAVRLLSRWPGFLGDRLAQAL